MSGNIYTAESETSSKLSESFPNIVTVARALNGKRMNKTIYRDGTSRPYDNAYLFKFFSVNASDLLELCELVKILLHRPQSCLIRGVAKDDSVIGRRLLHYDPKTKTEPTIIEQSQNWFALDVDGFGYASGNIKEDAKMVLLALGLADTQCFAIPSASYLIKSGIRLRLFLWNNVRVTCLSLKKHFSRIVDPALFHPIQPIYTARPTFVNMNDPCRKLVAWIPGDNLYTSIYDEPIRASNRPEERYTKKQAEAFLNKKSMELWSDTPDQQHHDYLFRLSIFLGKLIAQDLIEEDTTVEYMMAGCAHYWNGDSKRDHQTITDGIKRGKQSIEGDTV